MTWKPCGRRGSTLVLVALVLSLAGCEIDEHVSVHRDSSAEVVVSAAVEDEWAGEVLPELKQQMLSSGQWKLVEEKHEAGRQILTFSRSVDRVSELSDADQGFELTDRRDGWFRKTYRLTVRQLRGSQAPVTHKIRITMPGTVGGTSGTRLPGSDVELDLTGALPGASWWTESSAWELPEAAQMSAALDSLLFRDEITSTAEGSQATVKVPRFAAISPEVARLVILATGALAILSLLLALMMAGTKLARHSAGCEPAVPVTKICASCGAGMAAGATFCPRCGTQAR
jgi:hypothetical protein